MQLGGRRVHQSAQPHSDGGFGTTSVPPRNASLSLIAESSGADLSHDGKGEKRDPWLVNSNVPEAGGESLMLLNPNSINAPSMEGDLHGQLPYMEKSFHNGCVDS